MACLAASLLLPARAHAVDTFWDNTGTGDWNTAGNWNPAAVPGGGDDAFIDNGGTAQVTGAVPTVIEVTVGQTNGNSGTLEITGGGTVSNFVGVIGNGPGSTGTVTVDGATWTNTGGLFVGNLGTGRLTIRNGGTVAAAGTVTLGNNAGVTGTLHIGDGGVAGVLNSATVNGGAGTATLNFNHTDTGYVFSNDGTAGGAAITITGSTAVTHTGSGTTILTGNNTYSGATTIDNGVLLVNGAIANSTTAVNAGGTLGGTGTVGSVTLNGGTFAPGNSIGTINVAGNVDFSGGGIYEVEVDAAGNSDLINATGTATLTGGSVLVVPLGSGFGPSTDYTILTAAGGLVGTFDSVTSTLAFLTPALSQDANNVFLNLLRNTLGFSDVTETPNQLAVSTTLEALIAAGTPALDDLFNNLLILTAEGANQAFDSLSGVQHTHAQTLALRANQQFQGLLFQRLSGQDLLLTDSGHLMLASNETGTVSDAGVSGLNAGDPLTPARGWWLRGFGGFGDIDDTANASGADYHGGGVALGVDTALNDTLTAGAAFAYTRTDADTARGRLDVNSYQGALYGGWANAGRYLKGSAGFGYHDADAKRRVAFGGFNQTAKADYNGWTTTATAEGGKDFDLAGRATLTPFLGLDYTHLRREGFTEQGAAAANLTLDTEHQDSLRSAVGVRLHQTFETVRGIKITPAVEAAWVHEYLDEDAAIDAGFAAAPASAFRIEGPELDRNRARVGAGLTAQLSEHSHLNIGYNGELAGSDDHHAFGATFRMTW